MVGDTARLGIYLELFDQRQLIIVPTTRGKSNEHQVYGTILWWETAGAIGTYRTTTMNRKARDHCGNS